MVATEAALSQRIKAEFDARAQRLKTLQDKRAKESEEREARLALFTNICDDLRSVWGPRLEEFTKQFGEKIKVAPSINPSHREVKVFFLTDLANMTLTLSALAGADVTKLVLNYDLLIIPMLFDYERIARLEVPIDKIDKDAIGRWIDNQLISCVKTYLSMQDNEFYIRQAMVEDPISKVRLLKDDAAAKFEHNGRTLYFASQENLQQYKQRHQLIPAGSSAKSEKRPAKA